MDGRWGGIGRPYSPARTGNLTAPKGETGIARPLYTPW